MRIAPYLFRSADGGTSFVQVSFDFAASLLADPAVPSRIIAGLGCGNTGEGAVSGGGFRISTDGGATFGSVIVGDCVAQLGDNGSALYAVGSNRFHVSTDHGDTWKANELAIPPGVFANSIASSLDGQTIYLGTSAGLYKSTTGGL